ncbi:hypothetical protein Sme01_40810 [Sphaerisporangium melleum]|uniref:Uncharacterized protein n=1 Tax=Sphaerisporangium melleum TaxID=321316 RepID=A0A917RCF4_9ACTN|nr:hypothetical protein GCM10007964_48610 [Sphaerisporangium melleum]GII71605.1 hypothetical protein Sme01_40810 [Sphaerisporangium melleum]
MSNPRTIRAIRIRWRRDAPPLPLGCRWCGHPPYDHRAHTLPHRRHHQWEQPTAAQMRARLDARRRLGGCDHPPAVPVRPIAVRSAGFTRPLADSAARDRSAALTRPRAEPAVAIGSATSARIRTPHPPGVTPSGEYAAAIPPGRRRDPDRIVDRRRAYHLGAGR